MLEKSTDAATRSNLLPLLFFPGGATNFAQFIYCIKEVFVRLDGQSLQQD
jgi:hypothetical protein